MQYSLKGMTVEMLEAICAKISGMCHRYKIESVNQNRVCISYSNPDEYGSERPIKAFFPIVLYLADTPAKSIACVEFFSSVTGREYEYQAFDCIRFATAEWNKEQNKWEYSI